MPNLQFSSSLLQEGKIIYAMDKEYLNELTTKFKVKPFVDGNINYENSIRVLQVKHCSYDKDDIISDSFKKVLNTFSNDINSLAIVFRRTTENTEMFLIIKNSENKAPSINASMDLLESSIKGNFPGVEIEKVTEINVLDNKSTHTQKANEKLGLAGMGAISYLINTPSEQADAHSTQNIERLLNGVIPKNKDDEYTVVILTESIPYDNIWPILGGHEELATYLSSKVNIQIQQGTNKSITQTEGITDSLGKSIGTSLGVTGGFGGFGGFGLYVTGSYSENETSSESKTRSENKTEGTSQNISLNHKDYKLANLLERIEQQIVRIKQGQANGLWNTSTYIFAKTPKQSKHVAQFFNSLSQSDAQYNATFFTQTWHNSNDSNDFNEATKYITHFCHPVLEPKADNKNAFEVDVQSSSILTTSEVSMLFSFPRYPIQGIPVFERVRFGREPRDINTQQQAKGKIELGCIQYLGKSEKTAVSLNQDELTKHVFVTGATGAGKSNSIYKILHEACPLNDKPKFMIIEPAKGEYKDVFGGREDVTVYGTNPYKTPNLLQINPFYFPKDIHVLEHIDRLVEVFNSCWPMYAAMPAILKETIEKSYQYCGWNLDTSKTQGDDVYPTFEILLYILPDVIKTGGYSDNTQSDYIGSLHTRIRSLTTGIYGQIFKPISNVQNIYDENTIIDLSRIGSQETKALLMGLLLLQLQEHRISENIESNGGLRHITVLEEAHTLLTRTSTTQTQESANLQGKSVEMFANAIAEMRTYGQGFIIADQSPGLLDMSVIRNTNSKIIHRLPSLEDRELVGYAAGLNNSQIDELSKLECGVAAISHSTWVEPVLCKVEKFEKCHKLDIQEYKWENPQNILIIKFFNVLLYINNTKFTESEYKDILQWIEGLGLKQKTKELFLKVTDGILCSDKQKIIIIRHIVESKGVLPKDTFDIFINAIKQTLYSLFSIESNSDIIKK